MNRLFWCLLPSLLTVYLSPVPSENRAPESQTTQSPSAARKPEGQPRIFQEFQITGERVWFDTGFDIEPGERVILTASGKLRYPDGQQDNGPEGLPRDFKDLMRILPLNSSGRGALIGRIGDPDIAQPFLISSRHQLTARVGGRLAIGINQMADEVSDGTYTVRVEIYPPESRTPIFAVRRVKNIAGFDQSLFSKIPRRVTDKDGNAGDMINFLIIGSESAVQNVLSNAGWVKVDTDPTDSMLRAILGSISREAYVSLPMSALYLFGRIQDYGWAHAEPIAVVASRHHLRIWKAPFEVHNRTLWIGAATHDIGFETDRRNGNITHKIDPAVDLERDYVEKTLVATGLVGQMAHFLPKNPVKQATTATGGNFHSDGRVLILEISDLAFGEDAFSIQPLAETNHPTKKKGAGASPLLS